MWFLVEFEDLGGIYHMSNKWKKITRMSACILVLFLTLPSASTKQMTSYVPLVPVVKTCFGMYKAFKLKEIYISKSLCETF